MDGLIGLFSELQRRPAAWSRASLSVNETQALRSAVLPLLDSELELSVREQRLAYATAEALIYPQTAAEAELLWASGKTAILQSLQMTPGLLNLTCAAAEVAFQRRVGCSAYLSAPKADTFSMHTDEWDAFLIQLEGAKTFVFEDPTSGAVVDEVLAPGDVVLMRRGVRHRVHSETTSLHISINLLPFPPRTERAAQSDEGSILSN